MLWQVKKNFNIQNQSALVDGEGSVDVYIRLTYALVPDEPLREKQTGIDRRSCDRVHVAIGSEGVSSAAGEEAEVQRRD